MSHLNLNDPYLRYYSYQAGNGVSNVFRGTDYQRGHGIGSFLGGLFRSVSPLIASGAKAIGREALRSGVGFLDDIVHARPPREAFKNRVRGFTGNLKRRADEKVDRVMGGSGYKRRRKTVTVQSITKLLSKKKASRTRKEPPVKRKSRKNKVKKHRKAKTVKDIFG